MQARPCLFCNAQTGGSSGEGNLRLAAVCQDCRDGIDASKLLTPGGRPEFRAWFAPGGPGAIPPGLDGDQAMRRTGAFVAGRAANDQLPLVSVGPGGIGHEYSTEIGGPNAR